MNSVRAATPTKGRRRPPSGCHSPLRACAGRATWLVLCGLVLLLAGATARAQARSQAARAFAEGEQLYKETDYEGAIKAFTRAQAIKPHYLITCNIARCHERLSDMVLAAENYRRCLAEGGAGSKQAVAIRGALRSVAAQIARITITSPGIAGTALVDGKEVGATPFTVALNPGTHTLQVRARGAEPASVTVEAGIGEKRTVELKPRVRAAASVKVKSRPGPRDPTLKEGQGDGEQGDGGQEGEGGAGGRQEGLPQLWFWTATAVTVGLAIAGTVLGVQTLEANDAYNEDPTQPGFDKVIGRRLLTNVFWGLAAGAAATSTLLFFYTDFSRGKDAATVGLQLRTTF